jgi:hypothetical protein
MYMGQVFCKFEENLFENVMKCELHFMKVAKLAFCLIS